MARRGSSSAVRWVTKLVNRKGKQFRQRYRVAQKQLKKLGKRVAKQAKREVRDFKTARARAAKKTARAKEKRAAKAAKSKTPSKWREVLVNGRRMWLRTSSGAMQSKKASALAALARHGSGAASAPEGLGKWHKTSKDNRHQRHRDYAGPHKPPKRRQG